LVDQVLEMAEKWKPQQEIRDYAKAEVERLTTAEKE
jgi:hypothetical protein